MNFFPLTRTIGPFVLSLTPCAGGIVGAVTLEAAAAVSAGAGKDGAEVGAAAVGLDAIGPVGIRDGDGLVGEGEAAGGEDGMAGVRLDGGPHDVVAVVDEG